MIRRSRWFRGRLLVLPLILLAGVTVTALGRGPGLAAWAARKVSASACSLLVRLKKALSATAAIEVRIMPSPKIGLS